MTERQELLEEAKALDIKFPKNIKTEELRKAVVQEQAAELAKQSFEDAGGVIEKSEPTLSEADIRKQIEAEFAQKLIMEKAKLAANMELNMAKTSDDAANNRVSVGQEKLKSRREALALIRVNVSCKDPMKASWTGELISAGNDVIGDVTKYIQFDTDEGYHIPQIILNTLKDKKCTHFVNKKINGQMTQVAKQQKAYSIEYLEQLTLDELQELGADQKARGAIDKD